jgi:hypothetical protein
MNEYQEKRRLAWEEVARHSIEPLNPATALAYQSLFYAGYDAASTEGAKRHINVGQDILIQESQSGIQTWPLDCTHRYIQGMCIDCGHLS